MISSKLPPPLVTVVIPVYNYADQVVRAINSVKEQTVSNFECFVIDDGSTDGTQQAVLDAIVDDPRFHYVYQDNAGVATARNNGVFRGTAPYVCCLDADDALAPEFLEACVLELEKDPSLGIAYTGLYYIKPDGEEGLSPWPGQYSYEDFLKGTNQIPTCNVARRKVWERLGGQRQRYAPKGAGEEDAEMWLRAGAYGWGAKKVTDGGLFIYSWQSGRVSGNSEHQIVDYKAWHPWTKDDQHPFASMAKPRRLSHPVRQYDEPTVSVVIPVGPGHEEDIINVLDSLEAQTFRKWEAIVVEDTRDTFDPDKWARIYRAYPYIRIYHTDFKRSGAGAARNIGAEKARAPFLVYVDADDWLHPDALQFMIDEWEKEPAVIYSDYVGKTYLTEERALMHGKDLLHYDPDKCQDEKCLSIVAYRSAEYDYDRAVVQPRIGEDGYMYVWCLVTALVPKAWHDEIGGFDETMVSWEDWDYWIRMAKAGKCFIRVPEQLVCYRFYTGTRREEGLQAHATLIEYLEKKYEGIETMACSCREKRKVQPVMRQPPVSKADQQSTQERSTTLSDNDFQVCTYNHPNRGAHRVFGQHIFPQRIPNVLMIADSNGFRIDYRHHGGGEKFYVHKNDIQAQPHIFVPDTPTPVVKTEIAPPPPPTRTMDVPAQPEQPMQGVETVEEQPEQPERPAHFDLQTIPGVTAIIAQQMNADGVHDLQDILKVGADGLQKYKGIGPGKATMIVGYATTQLGG